jgi:hypothetical protein
MRRARGSEAGKLALDDDGELTLLALIASHVDKNLLEQIAAANDGVDQTRHLVALLKIWKTGVVSGPLQRHPREVLDIVRGGKLGNLACAFSCSAMLSGACANNDAEAPVAFSDFTPQLILSLDELPFPTDNEAKRFLESLPVSKMLAAERVLIASGILWFALRNNSSDVARTLELIAGVTRKHFDAMSANWGLATDELALPDMTVLNVDRSAWLRIAERMCDMDFSQLDRSLAGKVGVYVELLRRALG